MARSRPRLTSIGALGLGAGWEWVSTDAEIVRRLIVFLEDRRALAYDHHREDVGYVVESVLRIREKLTEALQQLAPESGANRSVRALRDACLVFLDHVDGRSWVHDPDFLMALGELRGVFLVYVRLLADEYGITVHGPLAPILRGADGDHEAADEERG
jgi:hypothetical protein